MSTLTTVALSLLLVAIALGSWYGVYEHVHASPGQDARLADLDQRVAALEKTVASQGSGLGVIGFFQIVWGCALAATLFALIALCEGMQMQQKKYPL
jgi:hypothetical protein